MKIVSLEPQQDDFTRGVATFFSSLAWIYVTHRYAAGGQGVLLLVLTVSGLDSWWWEQFAMWFAKYHYQESALVRLVANKTPDTLTPDELRLAISEVVAYAGDVGASVAKPPVSPTYLASHGITQERYVELVQAVYDKALEGSYHVAWPQSPFALAEPLVQPVLLHQAVAIMGATAGAIERLMALGGIDGDHRD